MTTEMCSDGINDIDYNVLLNLSIRSEALKPVLDNIEILNTLFTEKTKIKNFDVKFINNKIITIINLINNVSIKLTFELCEYLRYDCEKCKDKYNVLMDGFKCDTVPVDPFIRRKYIYNISKIEKSLKNIFMLDDEFTIKFDYKQENYSQELIINFNFGKYSHKLSYWMSNGFGTCHLHSGAFGQLNLSIFNPDNIIFDKDIFIYKTGY